MNQYPFSIVPIEVIQDRRLALIETRVLVALLSFRNKNTNTCWPSRAAIAKRCGYQETVISRALTKLVEKGWLIRKQHRGPNTFEINVPEVTDQVTMTDPVTVTDQVINSDRLGAETVTDPVTPEHKRTDQRTDHNMSSKKPLDESAKNILHYLNEKSGRNYKAVASNLKLISARLKEGHSVKEIKSVIDEKCAQWRNDPKMCEYLRPATLFGAEKFNQYVGQIGTVKPNSGKSEYRKALEQNMLGGI